MATPRSSSSPAGYRAPTIAPAAFGDLLVGYYQEGRLVYRGRVGTGLTDAMLAHLQDGLAPLACEDNVFDAGGLPPWELRFIRPQLVCEVEFLEWTRRSGQLRHPSFRGLRTDKHPSEVVREDQD